MLLNSAAMLGIDACPLEGIDPQQYDRVLGLSESNYSTRVACALGYRSSEDKAAQQSKVRFPSERVFSYR
jgi:nitroreductase